MKWFNKEDPPPCFDQNVEQVLLWSILDFIFVMKRSRFEMSPDDPMRIDACLGVAARIADEIDNVAHNGALVIMQDSASCMTANLVDFARKVGSPLPANTRYSGTARARKSHSSSRSCTAYELHMQVSRMKTRKQRRRTLRDSFAAF